MVIFHRFLYVYQAGYLTNRLTQHHSPPAKNSRRLRLAAVTRAINLQIFRSLGGYQVEETQRIRHQNTAKWVIYGYIIPEYMHPKKIMHQLENQTWKIEIPMVRRT